MVSITMASMSYSFALIYRIEDPLAPTLNTITLPLSLLSGIMLPLALAPLWLQDLAKANPFSYAVNASRALFAGSFHSVDIIKGFVIVFLLMSVVFWWSLNSLRKLEE
jgi:ABC-2 type transport system permease protein